MGAAGAAGCNGRLTPEAERLLSDGIAAYKGGDDGGAIRSMDLFLRDHARSKRADEAYYYRGLAKYRSKDLTGAKADFKQAFDFLERLYPQYIDQFNRIKMYSNENTWF